MVVLPLEQIPREPLMRLIEEFVTRDGTDYGLTECPTAEKVRQVEAQLQHKTAYVVFDEESESLNIVTADALRAAGVELSSESETQE